MNQLNLRIKPQYSIIAHTENCVELRAGVWNPVSHVINDETKTGKLFSIIRELNGRNSAGDVAKKTNVSRAEVESIIDYLQSLNVLEWKSQTAFEAYLDLTTPAVCKSYYTNKSEIKPKFPLLMMGERELVDLIQRRISNHFSDDIACDFLGKEKNELMDNKNVDWMSDGLLQEEMLSKFEEFQKHFWIFAQRDIDPIKTTKINRITHELNIPWLHLAIDGPFLFVGPLFSGKSGPCFDCFETRVLMNLREQEAYQKYKQALIEGKVYNQEKNKLEGILGDLISAHAQLEIVNFILTESSFVKNKVLAIYLPTMEFTYNEILKLSGCKTCSSLKRRDDTQLYFDFHALIKKEGAQ